MNGRLQDLTLNMFNVLNHIKGGGFDPDAQAFITAAGITGTTQKNALNQLVLDLKGSGSTTNNTDVWSNLYALYPFCPIDGSTATLNAYKWNLKDPRDLDAAFRITWINSPTATVSGAQGNGSNQYGRTHYIPSVDGLQDNHMFGYFGNSSSGCAIGSRDTKYNAIFSNSFWGVNGSVLSVLGFANTEEVCIIQRTASNAVAAYQGSSTPTASSTSGSTGRPAVEYYLLGQNFNNSFAFGTNILQKAFYIGQSLTTNEITDFIFALKKFNTALGR